MIEGLKDFILNGGNFMNLAGNSLYWKYTIKNNQLEVESLEIIILMTINQVVIGNIWKVKYQ